MSSDTEIAGPPNLMVERAFVALLSADPELTGLGVYPASDREVRVPPLHCFVYCQTVDPLLPVGPIYKADIAVTLVTNIDDHTTAIRSAWWTKVLAVLGRASAEQEFDAEFAIVKGWTIKTLGEVSEGQQTGDVARLSAGIIL